MKKLTLLLLSVLFFATYTLQAQKQFSGEIRFETKIEGTNDPNILSSVDETPAIDVAILGNKSKTMVKNDMYSFTQIWDGDKGTAAIVIEVLGMGKFYKKWDAEQHKERLRFSEFSYSPKNEFREICGYKCQKVVATITNLEDDSQREVIFYVTKEIGTAKLNGLEYPGLEGYPLLSMTPVDEYCEGCVVALEAIKVTPKKIKEVDFLLPSDAKNIDDDPELREMFGF
jgi:hypothetical protein